MISVQFWTILNQTGQQMWSSRLETRLKLQTIIAQHGERATDWTPSEMAVQHQKERWAGLNTPGDNETQVRHVSVIRVQTDRSREGRNKTDKPETTIKIRRCVLTISNEMTRERRSKGLKKWQLLISVSPVQHHLFLTYVQMKTGVF